MTTSVASAATKTIADQPVLGMFGKASSQNSESGEFAQALTDADSDTETSLSGNGEAGEAALSEPDGMPSTGRFKSLTDLSSLSGALKPVSTAVTGPEGAVLPGQPSQQGQQVQAADPKALLQATAGQQVPLPTADAQLPQQTILKPPAQVTGVQTPAASSPPAEGEDILNELDLTQLVPVLTGGKRASGTSAVDGKGEARPASAQDETVEADQAEAGQLAADMVVAVPLDALSATALSTEALLRLTSAPSAETSQDLEAMVPALAVEAPALDEDLQPDDLMAALPSNKDDGSLDFLSSLDGSSDATEPASFRFQKAGDAVAVSLSMTKNEDGGAELQDSLPTTAKPETITILDSRRYLGFGMGTNASSILSAASKDPDWAAAMHPASALSNAASASSTGNVVNTLKLQLNPENLGAVTANMRLVGEELSIHLTVHSSMAYRELSDDVKPMLDSLRAQGFNVDQVTVSIAPAADTGANTSGDQPQGNAQTQQQLARDGEAARQQAQGQGRAANQSDRNDMENRNETAAEAGISRGNSSGDIYL
ncbi:flagellar hook-length control protein FliK [Rhizobium deserti]|uniref:Flagellar hook-length control protein FliK n=1 Tax=Rhizobium deserti TaxID=2547961 RepID=A0A4R5UH18_9HYPH|nr:flagellar hook-length control protein FliK [Rhizobium deserti]TDK35096.1 flagellar hook-length control protein FliK [Rhizobium deserti]